MVGLTREQVRLLNEWSKGLWVLLDQSDFENIQKIFKKYSKMQWTDKSNIRRGRR